MGRVANIDLTNHFLIATPGIGDGTFSQSVIYICEHNEHGALGLVVNKLIDVTLEQLFGKVNLMLKDIALLERPVHFGGPVQTESGFVLHEPVFRPQGQGQENHSEYTASLQVPSGLEMTSSKDILEAIASGQGPQRFLITLGYSGWDAGQLELELSRNGWLTVQADADVIFDTPVSERYTRALSLLGIQPGALVGDIGHA